jgi:hypothetical protein
MSIILLSKLVFLIFLKNKNKENTDNLIYLKYQDYRICLSNNAIYEYFYGNFIFYFI